MRMWNWIPNILLDTGRVLQTGISWKRVEMATVQERWVIVQETWWGAVSDVEELSAETAPSNHRHRSFFATAIVDCAPHASEHPSLVS